MKCDKLFKNIGARIKARRKELGLTQVRVCAILDCDKRYYQKIESGQASITVTTLQKIAEALQIKIELLLRSDDVPEIESTAVAEPVSTAHEE